MTKESFIKRLLFLCALLVIFDLFYPITYTYDSSHYLFLADIIKTGDWANWDPVRGLGFPLLLRLSFIFAGETDIGILLLMIFFHIISFYFSFLLIVQILKIQNYSDKFIVSVLLFLFIFLDPIVFGYYHACLTEFVAASVAIVSSYMAYKYFDLFRCGKADSSKTILYTLYFVAGSIFIWHIKQSYVSTTLIPFGLVFLLLLIKIKRKFIVVNGLFSFGLIFLFLFCSIKAWDLFLEKNGMPKKPDRSVFTLLDKRFAINKKLSISGKFDRYLAISNFYGYDWKNDIVDKTPSFNRAYENKDIAYRQFEIKGQAHNITGTSDFLYGFVSNFLVEYKAPKWFNKICIYRTSLSNFIFTLLFLLLPIGLIIALIRYAIYKEDCAGTLFILLGTSFINAISHVLFIKPIDRYNFYGYPLLLLGLVVIFYRLIKKILIKGI